MMARDTDSAGSSAAASSSNDDERCLLLDVVELEVLELCILTRLPLPSLFKLRRVCQLLKQLATGAIRVLPRPVVLGGTWTSDECDCVDGDNHTSVFQLSWPTMQWELLPSPQHMHAPAAACCLDDGTLLVISCPYVPSNTSMNARDWSRDSKAEMLAPNGATWQTLPVPALVRPEAALAALPGRRALLCGGRRYEQTPCIGTRDAFVLDLDAEDGPTWLTVEPMFEARYSHSAVALPSGHVIVAGGGTTPYDEEDSRTDVCEIFDPVSCSWLEGEDDREWGNMPSCRQNFAMALAAVPPEGHLGISGRRQVPALPPFAVLTLGGNQGIDSAVGKIVATQSLELPVHLGDKRSWADRALARLHDWPDEDDRVPEEKGVVSVRTCGWEKTDVRVYRDELGGCSIRGCVLISGGEGRIEPWMAKEENRGTDEEYEVWLDDDEYLDLSTDDEDDGDDDNEEDRAGARLTGAQKRQEEREERADSRSAAALFDAHERRWYRLPPLPEPRVGHAMIVPAEHSFWS